MWSKDAPPPWGKFKAYGAATPCSMIEILLFGLLGLVLAGKGRPKRSYRAYLRGNVDESLNLGTLATLTLVSVDFDESVNETTWLSSVKGSYTLDELTPGQGPIFIGLAHSDYSDAEIEEWIETTQSWNAGDLVAKEVARRKIRRIGVFPAEGGALVTDTIALNGGRPITTKCGFLLQTGQTASLWAYNMGPANLSATVPIVRVQGHANLWPRG